MIHKYIVDDSSKEIPLIIIIIKFSFWFLCTAFLCCFYCSIIGNWHGCLPVENNILNHSVLETTYHMQLIAIMAKDIT